ncbi:MAG: F0F1 ATP synthase subunit A [Alphaproteobacteria bacterium]|nr:F0F1 ATP synthase subunit A [Alphaproteobacteria bacterium]
MASPLEQFTIKPIVSINIGGLNLSYTNSALYMTIAVVVIVLGLVWLTSRRDMVPGRGQGFAESIYEFIAGLIRDNAGEEAMRYFPLIFSVFVFVAVGNVIGMIPGTFTYTSHIAVNFALALFLFIVITGIGIARHGTHFFSLFLPEGTPGWLAPLMVPIEVIAYLSRPVSLAVRLFANMTAGHIIMKVFAGFVISLGGFFVLPGIFPFALLFGLTGLEIFIAVLQAYIFTILACVYLHDAIHLH